MRKFKVVGIPLLGGVPVGRGGYSPLGSDPLRRVCDQMSTGHLHNAHPKGGVVIVSLITDR